MTPSGSRPSRWPNPNAAASASENGPWGEIVNDAADSAPADTDPADTDPAEGDPAAGEYSGRADDVLADMAAPSGYVLGPMVAGGSDIPAVTWTGPEIAATTSRGSGRGWTS